MSTRKTSALGQGLGELKSIRQNLSGGNGYLWLAAIQNLLYTGVKPKIPSFWLWRKIISGKYKSAGSFYEDCKLLGVHVYDTAKLIVDELKFKQFPEYDVFTVKVTIKDLGFPEEGEYFYETILMRALTLGLKKCTRFDALTLRTDFLDQAISEDCKKMVLVGTDVISHEGDSFLFELVNHHGKICLSTMPTVSICGRNKFGMETEFLFKMQRPSDWF